MERRYAERWLMRVHGRGLGGRPPMPGELGHSVLPFTVLPHQLSRQLTLQSRQVTRQLTRRLSRRRTTRARGLPVAGRRERWRCHGRGQRERGTDSPNTKCVLIIFVSLPSPFQKEWHFPGRWNTAPTNHLFHYLAPSPKQQPHPPIPCRQIP
jgi:hypothetical protein